MTDSPFGDVEYATTRDGRRLRYMLADHGDGPIVVFESGMGGAHTSWGLVQPELAQSGAVYCRAGYADSDAAPEPRTLDGMADDLSDLLDVIAVRKPDHKGFILVGHSLGGLIVPRAARRARQPIAGLVLVDPAPLRLWKAEKARRMTRRSRKVMAAVVGFSPARAILLSFLTRGVPSMFAAEAKRFEFTAGSMKAWEQEERALIAASDEFDPSAEHVSEVPVIVLTSGKIPRNAEQMYREIVADHERIAATAPRGTHRVVQGSGHQVPREAPRSIIEAIDEIAAAT
ncbi:alpha/beta fold hydrolase [Tsukamurella strandjordii]|uniref:Alpha/beta fold hydrolase n=1 Tax=Tsukamurella strandjordii TaxID=147577 RepID=A0AA90NJZ2_9ACTN|nr:alpha/beta hydrolase [Tsukamurella strandjordii]MDP0399896.1 alpha/beta fold hydrolase [Tsukamurella strandjordii]